MTADAKVVRNQPGFIHATVRLMCAWFGWRTEARANPDDQSVDWVRIVPYMGMHLMCFGVIWVGISVTAVAVAVGLYFVRMFAITAFYHRYFSHRTFKTSRFCQFIFAVMGLSAAQRGPLWWSSHHREHHRNSDGEDDVHSPHQHGFWWSHVGWITSRSNYRTKLHAIPDLVKFPELRLLERLELVVPILLATFLFGVGAALEAWVPAAKTTGPQMLIWGFFISTVFVAHATFTINSLSHLFGNKRYKIGDESRNNIWLAFLTLGEGWHNNHHYYSGSVRQGFYWWEVDISYYGLWLLSRIGLVWDLKPVPRRVREANHIQPAA